MADHPEPPDLEVNIPSPSGLRVTADEPYRILLISDLAGTECGSVTGPLTDGLVEINAETFDQVMAQADPCVSFKASHPVAAGNVMIELGLRFESLKAFSPEALVRQIPATQALMDVREKITARLQGKGSADDLSAAVAAAAGRDADLAWLVDSVKPGKVQPAASPDQVDAALAGIDLGGDEPTETPAAAPPKSPIGSIVSAAAAKSAPVPPGETSSLRRTLVEIDKQMSTWLTAVLHAPEVQQMETAWRSLGWLVSKIEFRKGVRLSVLHAPAGKVCERLISAVIDPVFDEGAAAPDLIVVDTLFGNSAPDSEALDEIAQHAASLPAVALAGLSPGFFGVKHAWQIPTLPPLVSMFDQWQFAKWKSLRGQPYARNIGVVFGRLLLRAPYDRQDGTDLDFRYQEKCVGDKDFVWASGALAGACTVAQSVAKTGWPAAMSGPVHGQIEGVPTALGGKKGDKQVGPSDLQIAEAKIQEMGMSGVNAVATFGGGADALLWNGMTAARPHNPDPAGYLEVSLPYHLLAGRLSMLLFALKPSLEGQPAEKVCGSVLTHVRTWLDLQGDAEDQVSAQVRDAEGDPTSFELAITVTPPHSLLPGAVPIVLGYRVARG